jgi:hypothetical protein
MKRSLTFKTWFVAVAAVVLSVSGCRCGNGGGPTSAFGETRIVVYTDGVATYGHDGTYDFGQVSMGKTVTTKLTIQNALNGVLSLKSFAKDSGDNVVVGTDIVESNPVFNVAFATTDIPQGETREFDITFTPPTEDKPIVPHLVVLKLTAGNVAPGQEISTITIKGDAVSGECALPDSIDFGAVARGDTFNVSQEFPNARPIDTVGFVGAIESQQGAGIFALTADSPRDTFNIPSKKSKTVTITFAPTEARDYFATVTMRKADGCTDKRVRLVGTGVDQVLNWAPATVDFGYVTPGLTVANEVVFSNAGLKPVAMAMLNTFESTTPSSIFKVTAASTGDLTKLVVPAGTRDPVTKLMVPGTATVKLSFKPAVLGPKTGTLRAGTDLRNQSAVVVPLRGVGGGPDIDIKPASPFLFGRIAYFNGANPASFASRKLTVQNVGTRPNPADPKANLRLGKTIAGGAGQYWKVTAKTGTLDTEICLGVFDALTGTCAQDLPTTGAGKYDPNIGLEASGTNALLDIPVRITPASVGDKEWDVTIYSNDPDEPEVTVTIKATAVVLPPCNFTVTPLALPFGVVSPPLSKDLGFQIRNTGTGAGDICLITNLNLLPETGTPSGMPAVFSLPAGDVAEKELQPGETWQVLTRAWPQGQLPPTPAAVTGKVQFNVSNQNKPQETVTLTATIAPSCLTIAPNDLDFGTVQKDCNSPDRPFLIYNTCTQPVTINSSSMVAAAGVPAGSPGCMGTLPCPEFFVTQGIANGTIVSPGATTPPNFKIKYRPLNYGPDTGAFKLSVTQSAQNVDYIVTLRGAGDTMGLNTDTFRQDSKPKADILLVLDDSCSMDDKLTSLSNNMGSFLQYARSSQVDFNISVTNTEMGGTYHVLGEFYPSPGGLKILKPSTPNLELEYAGMVKSVCPNNSCPGGSESCLEGAVRALTPPLITGPNAGFLRPDAVLAVVCVTDAEDQGPQPLPVYLNTLLNIKGAQRQGMFTYNVIGPFLSSPPTGCYYDSTSPDPSMHLGMVAATGGVKEEICTPDWATALQNIGKSAFGFRTNFYLTARPDLSSMRQIEVGIDSVACSATTTCPTGQVCSTQSSMCVLPGTDARGASVWTYDPTTNSVNFEPLYVPEPGKTLTVTYQVSCIL